MAPNHVAAEALLDAATGDVRLEAEVAAKGITRFQTRYQSITGSAPATGFLDIGAGKWGAELRVYFNSHPAIAAGLRTIGYHVETRRGGYNGQFRYRINNNELWWHLIQSGWRLGNN